MAMRNNKALGKGLNALFRQEPKDGPNRDEISGERNFEFYGSLMKRYVQSGSKDPVIGQMLEEIREHLCISPEEHMHLLATLQKREEARHDRAAKENWDRAQDDIKGELTQMFSEYKVREDCGNGGQNKVDQEEPIEFEEIPSGPIALMERNPTIIPDDPTMVISAPPSPPEIDRIEMEDAVPPVADDVEPDRTDAPMTPMEGAIGPKMAPTPPKKDTLLDLLALMEQDDLDEALEMADRLLKEDPYSVSVLNEKGVILFNMGRIDAAIECYDRGLALEPDSTELNVNLALTLSFSGQMDRSLDMIDRAIRKDPYNEDAWNNKAVVLTRAGRLRDALNCLDESIRINDRSLTAWQNSGIILERMGEYGPALECYQRVLELDPSSEMALKGSDYCRSRSGA